MDSPATYRDVAFWATLILSTVNLNGNSIGLGIFWLLCALFLLVGNLFRLRNLTKEAKNNAYKD